MSQKPIDCAVLLLADPHTRRIALGKRKDTLFAPCDRPQMGDGVAERPHARISKERLGCAPSRIAAFQDAALRALFEQLGQLIAQPVPTDTVLAKQGEWGHLSRHFLAPDRMALTYLGRVIDPVEKKKRRHRRIFAAPLSKVSNSIKQSGDAKALVWVSPEKATERANDPGLEPFIELALSVLGGRPHPLKVSFRAGQRVETRL